MGAAIAIDPRVLRQLSQPRTAAPSQLQHLARDADALAAVVENRWSELPQEARERLKALAYALVEPPKGLRRLIGRVTGRAFLALAVLRGETDALYEYLSALRRVIHAVLTAVEREDAAYREALATAVGEALDDSAAGSELSPETLRAWLADVSRATPRSRTRGPRG